MAPETQRLAGARELENIMPVCPFPFPDSAVAQENHRCDPQVRAWTLGQLWQLCMGTLRAEVLTVDAGASVTPPIH